jgi:hypothetical protein
MYAKLAVLIFSLLAELASAITNLIFIASALVLGNQTGSNDPGTYRDGGWGSQIGSTYLQFYADTQRCDATNAANNWQDLNFCANTLALSTCHPSGMKRSTDS